MRITISTTIDTRTLRKLDKYRNKRGLSRSRVIQWAIEDYLKREESKDDYKG